MRIRCYDDGKCADRYTVVFLDLPERASVGRTVYEALGMSGEPSHPQGIGQHCTAMLGRHLGRLIPFAQLPDDCRKLVLQDADGLVIDTALKACPSCGNYHLERFHGDCRSIPDTFRDNTYGREF